MTIVTSPPPSSGGVGILQMLGMLEGTGYEKAGAGSASAVHYMAEAMRRYFADRSEHLGDPDFVKVPLSACSTRPTSRSCARPSIPSAPPRRARSTPRSSTGHESNETTHYSVADADGNIAIVTYTLNGGYGSKVTADGPRLPAQQRDGRLRAQARRSQHVRPDSGRSQRHSAAQDAALVDDPDHRAARTASRFWRWARRAARRSSTRCSK